MAENLPGGIQSAGVADDDAERFGRLAARDARCL